MSELDLGHHKPLPSIGSDSLPVGENVLASLPPPLPSKFSQDETDNMRLGNLPSFGSIDAGLDIPLTPTLPTTPSTPSFSSADTKAKKSNPLNDLIDTEKIYVDQLTGIIRKVAAAWSRSNLPPPDLDIMFRSIEGVYKANRGLHSKLKEIGANPSSPKALGDLLMRWIDDLNAPYTAYCTKYRCGFDTWEAIQSNSRLPDILSTFSASNPPPLSAVASNSSSPATWTLDDLFLLPKARLKYYKKLYGRLLKSTAPGRSDHRLLVGAVDTLDTLLSTLESRGNMIVGQPEPLGPSPSAPVESEDAVVIDLRTNTQGGKQTPLRNSSESSSARGSSLSSGERLSRETASTSIRRGSSATLSMPISDLERRLATQRTLDIFTMKPKVVRLQITPPSLTYTRELRFSIDVVIRFTPRATGVEVVHFNGHIFLLSDLFLVCEKMTPDERAQNGADGADMWLCYPPLAGKVLRVSEVTDDPNSLQVAIMRKETLIIQAESNEIRNFMLTQLTECIEFASSAPPVSKQPPPPMPPLTGLPRSPSAPLEQSRANHQPHSNSGGNANPPKHRSSSPSNPSLQPQPPMYQNPDGGVVSSQEQGAHRAPSVQDPGPPYSRTSLSTQPHPNQILGPGPPYPTRSTSFGQQGPPHPGPGTPTSPTMTHHPPPPFHPQNYPNNQPFPPNRQSPYGPPPHGGLPPRPPSEPSFQGGIRKSPSGRSLASQFSHHEQSARVPPVPSFPGGHPPNGQIFIPRSNSYGNLHAPQPRPLLPSMQITSRAISMAEPSFDEPSPPNSPVQETPQVTGPVTSTISAQMKCKVFLQQQHAQWKSLGSAKLKLYRQDPTNVKQLVVEADNKDKSILISTIVLTDGVERVGKTGVAIELSDQGARTGIIYMIQLRNENSAGGLFDSLIAGSDRAARS